MPRYPFEVFKEILCLHHSPLAMVVAETKHKLEGTYMRVNGEIAYLSDFGSTFCLFVIVRENNTSELMFECNKKYELDVKPIHIDSGVYFIKGVPFLVTKKARKYYKKSYYPEAYNISAVSNDNGEYSPYGVVTSERKTIYRYQNGIFYMNRCIGRINGGVIVPYNLFKNEIEEAVTDGLIKV